MEKHKFEEFLKNRYYAALGTFNEDGSIHLTAIWYLYQDGDFYLPTSSKSKKARNIGAQSRASVMVDVRGKTEVSGVSASGEATIITGERASEINRRIHRRYMSEEAMADPEVGPAFAANDNITIKITPEKWISWGTDPTESELLKAPGYRLPLD